MNTLLLIGSPKPGASASRSFGEAVTSRLAARGADTRTARVTPSFRSPEAMDRLMTDIDWADLVLLSSPVYVDTLPAPVMRLLETWNRRGRAGVPEVANRPPVRLATLLQCGFPEAHHCAAAIDVCEEFCRESGVAWAGALAFGCGGALSGRTPERSPLAKAVPALDEAADALAAGREIPDEARRVFGRQFAPTWAYTLFGGLGWWWIARKRGGREPLRLRRYPQ
jgi:NAD(P)H-dependent FMN reductase